jgi:hypothetical protein
MPAKKILIAILAILVTSLACRSAAYHQNQQKTAEPPSDVYLSLRNIWFTSTGEEVGVKPDTESTVPFAVVMDMGFDQGAATIVSSIAGDGSMYTSSGGGMLGGIDHEPVCNASIQFVQVAADYAEKGKLVIEYPLPAADNVIFYFITPSGVYATEEMNADQLAKKKHEFYPLFLAGNDVITQLRLLSGK